MKLTQKWEIMENLALQYFPTSGLYSSLFMHIPTILDSSERMNKLMHPKFIR